MSEIIPNPGRIRI